LEEIIRLIQVRCRFDEEEDDYLTEKDEGFIDLCPKCRQSLRTNRLRKEKGFLLGRSGTCNELD